MKWNRDIFTLLRWGTWFYVACVLLFLITPLLVVIPAAFSDSTLLQFPPEHWSTRWFEKYLSSPDWMVATWNSFKVAVAVSILATSLGLTSAIVLVRFRFIGRNALRAVILAPLIVPVIVTAVAIYYFILQIGWAGNLWALILSHTVVTYPYATVVISSALAEFDQRLEDAAVGLGASRVRAFFEVSLPIIRPAVIVSFLFAFLLSLDEVVITIFVSGPETMTLSRRLWDGVRFELEPTIAAVSTCLIVTSSVIVLAAELLRHFLMGRVKVSARR